MADVENYQFSPAATLQQLQLLAELTDASTHFFNNIFGGILCYSELIGGMPGSTEDEQIQQFLHTIEENTERGASQCQTLLVITRLTDQAIAEQSLMTNITLVENCFSALYKKHRCINAITVDATLDCKQGELLLLLLALGKAVYQHLAVDMGLEYYATDTSDKQVQLRIGSENLDKALSPDLQAVTSDATKSESLSLAMELAEKLGVTLRHDPCVPNAYFLSLHKTG